jgi:hypothetical protein
MTTKFDTLTTEQKKAFLNEKLHHGETTVTFTKVSGEKRVMLCTLDTSLLPPTPVTENAKPRKINPDVIRVFCPDIKEWRSFRVDSVIGIV